MVTENMIAFKKWRLKAILKWLGACGFVGIIIPLAVYIGGFWMNLAQIGLPMAFGIMMAIDIKNGYTANKNKNS